MSTTTSSPSTSPLPPTDVPPGFEEDELFAGLVATVLPFLAERGLDHPSLDEVFESCGVCPTRAAEAAAALLEEFRLTRRYELRREALGFVMDHPGAVEVSPRRRYYSRGYRRFVVDLCRRYGEIPLEELAQALHVPQATLGGWLRRARKS